jgi:hypothetical protein
MNDLMVITLLFWSVRKVSCLQTNQKKMNGSIYNQLGGVDTLTGNSIVETAFAELLSKEVINPDDPLAKALINLQYYDDNLPTLTVPALNVTSQSTPNTDDVFMNSHQVTSLA